MNNFFVKKLCYNFYDRKTRKTIAFINDDYPSILNIECAGLPSLNRADITIYNLNKDVMNLLTFLAFKNLNVSDVAVECLNENKTIFVGDVIASTPVYNMPDPYLSVQAMTDLIYLISPSKDIIYDIPPEEDYLTIPIRNIAKDILFDTKKAITYNDIGNAKVTDPRYLGSKIQQLEKLKTDADINIVVNHDSIGFFSKYAGISEKIFVINANSNKIIEQIANDKEGVNFRILFENQIELGGKIQIIGDKVNRQANGIFYVYDVRHELSNKIPNGNFFTAVKARYLGGSSD